MRLHEIDTFWIIIGLIAVSIVIFLIFNRNTGDPLLDNLNKFKLAVIMGGIFLFGMYMIMPNMSAFHYPYDVEDVNSPEEVLKYLQHQNNAIERLIDITRWSFFIIAMWVFTAAYNFLKAFGDHLKKEKEIRKNESNT